MTKKNIFPSDIYQRGKEYFNRGRLTSLKQMGTRYEAVVRGTKSYHVVLEYNHHNQIIEMSCDCPYALEGHRCKHEAALFIAVSHRRMQQQDNQENPFPQGSLTEEWNHIRKQSYSWSYIHREFKNVIDQRLCFYKSLANKGNLNVVSYILQMSDEFGTLPYDANKQEEIYDLFIKSFFEIMNLRVAYYNRIFNWIKTSLINGENEAYANFFLYFLKTIEPVQRLDVCKEILLHEKNPAAYIQNSLFECVNQAIKELQADVMTILKSLEPLSNTEGYQRILLAEFVKRKEYTKAEEILNARTNTLSFFEYAEEVYYELKDKERYGTLIYQLLVKSKNKKCYSYLKKLKKLYGSEWSTVCFEFYDSLYPVLTSFDFESLIEKAEEVEYAVYYVLKNPNRFRLEQMKEQIITYDPNLYFYLVVNTIMDQAKEAYGSYFYQNVCESLQQLLDAGLSKEAVYDVVMRIEYENPEKKELHEEMEQWMRLEKGEKQNAIRF